MNGRLLAAASGAVCAGNGTAVAGSRVGIVSAGAVSWKLLVQRDQINIGK